jgi:hypothetical protein
MYGLNSPERITSPNAVDNKLFDKDIAAIVHDVAGENLGDKNKPKDNRKKIDQTKPTALSLLDDKTEVKDLFENFSERVAKSKLLKDDMQQLGRTQSKLSSEMEKLYKQENQSMGRDEVVLQASQYVQQMKSEERKTRERVVDIRVRDTALPEDADPLQHQQVQQKQVEKAQQQSRVVQDQQTQIRPQQEMVKQYVMAFAETLIRPDQSQKKQAARDVRDRLLSSGYSPKQLMGVEQNVQNMIRQDLRKRIKEGFVQFALSYSEKVSPELVKIHKQFDALEKMGFETGVLSKEGFPSPKDVKDEAKSELRAVVSDELDRELMETKLKGGDIKELMKAFNKFNELATVVKFDANTYVKGFQTKLEDLGLHYFEAPMPNTSAMDTDAGGGRQQQNPEDQLSVEAVESLEDKLRMLFMRKHTKTDFVGSIENKIQLMKAQGKLKKAGLLTEALLARLQEEGTALAKTKFGALLGESLEEKASLSVLAGPAYDLMKKKMKTAMRGLKRLGGSLSKEELITMRDAINRHMFSVVKEEFLKIEALLGSNPADPRLTKHRDMLLGHLNRLKSESEIREEIRPQILQNLQVAESSVVEAA